MFASTLAKSASCYFLYVLYFQSKSQKNFKHTKLYLEHVSELIQGEFFNFTIYLTDHVQVPNLSQF